MLFNKDNTGSQELKALIGWLYKSNNFANIKTDIILAEEEITKLIGEPVYELADNHYNDNNSGSGSGSSSDLLDELVEHIQLPVGLLAYKEYTANSDLSHEDNGRKVKIDNENEKLPWEWMLDRDNAAILNKYHKTVDRLIAFLEKNEDNISQWKNSEAQILARKMFIKNAEKFDEHFPIDKSRAFYLRILPFMRIIEQRNIMATLGKTNYDELKEAIKEDTLSTNQKELLLLTQNAIAPLVMSMAVKRLSLEVVPSGVIQNYISQTTQAKSVAPTELINNMADVFKKDGEQALRYIQEYLRKQAADEAGDDFEPQDIMPENSATNKFFQT